MQVTSTPDTVLHDRYVATTGRAHLTGVQALVRLPLDVRRADQRATRRTAAFISGYEGSPLAGYDLELNRQRALLDELDIVFRPGVNEELAATAVQGAQLAATMRGCRVDGVTGFWYGKTPGLDRAADALRHANLAGAHPSGGAVALVGDDPGAKSSTMPGASEALLADLGMPTLYPADSQDVLDLGQHAVAMSRASGLWVGMKITTSVADGSSTVLLDPARVAPIVNQESTGIRFRHEVTGKLLNPVITDLERSRNGVRSEIAVAYARIAELNRIVRSDVDDRIGIVAAGKTFNDVRQALEILGLDDDELTRRGVRLLRLAMIHPVEPDVVRRFSEGLDDLIVVEEKRAFVELAVKNILYGRQHAPRILGRKDESGQDLFRSTGELDPDSIASALAGVLSRRGSFPSVDRWRAVQSTGPDRAARKNLLPLAPRTPYFCSGCPHNTSTKVPDDSLVGAGIGCHTMVLMMQPKQVGEVAGLTQMGGEGAQWVGMSPFLDRAHFIQNIGDGTFHHSGSLAIRQAVASGTNITYKLLYNSAVAMTGGQDIVGGMTIAQIVRQLHAEGVAGTIVTSDSPGVLGRRERRLAEVWPTVRAVEAQERLAGVPGVTVLIHDQECASELRRKRKRGQIEEPTTRVVINERICEGCGDCGAKSNCLSVQPVATEFGRKTRIDQSSCNKDYTCIDGDCPAFIRVRPGSTPVTQRRAPDLPPANSVPHPLVGSHTTRILGIGGTGVVTLAQVLSTAATRSDKYVVTLDQTGLAQKGGAVVSDVTVSDRPLARAGKAIERDVDLYLGADLLVAADPKNLAATAAERTIPVISTARVPTGPMVADVKLDFPSVPDVVAAIQDRIPTDRGVYLDAREITRTLFGGDQSTNLFLAGIASGLGAMPIPASAIEEAIALNGAAVAQNTQAFRRGQQYVLDPAAFRTVLEKLTRTPNETEAGLDAAASALVDSIGAEPNSELHRLLEIRVPELIAYQSHSYARRYTEQVAWVAQAERARVPGSTGLTMAVARHLYKLMAYKDEYEVARLALDPIINHDLTEQFGTGVKTAVLLHPPVLRAFGLKHKLAFGPAGRIALIALTRMRRLRGTVMDPFGHSKVRRTERALVREYVEALDLVIRGLSPANVATAIAIAQLPDLVRGFEDVKMKNVAEYQVKLAELVDKLGEGDSDRIRRRRPDRPTPESD
ncbi:indolepyruvate ferredoxin oxidoreductase family protein [uncultured Jatrophihabitans sp.]|uniref:indolepyruvate ferredoxin oxidoreductase family protein n=1 Tax=uncultured Jatrophihabitans sp. TaxID=1610747 RepID=UPI0035CC4A11